MQAEKAGAEAHNMSTPSAVFRFPSPGFTVILERDQKSRARKKKWLSKSGHLDECGRTRGRQTPLQVDEVIFETPCKDPTHVLVKRSQKNSVEVSVQS